MAIKTPTKTSKVPAGLSFDSAVAAEGGTATNRQTGAVTTAPVAPTSNTGMTPANTAVATKPLRYTGQDAAPGMPTPTSYNGSPLLNKPTLGAVDENTIREETRKRMQSSIDAINANYTNLISQEKVIGQDRAGQTRAIDARSGTMSSDFGQAQQEKTTQFNKQQEKYLADEQNAKVQSILLNIEDRASAEIQRQKQEALGQYQMDMGEYEKAQETARADLKVLAESGVDLNSLNPAQKAALLKQSGYEEGMGELVYNAMKPKPKQIDYKFEKLADGRGMFYGVDPQTGELKRVDVSVDLPPDWQMQIAPDGTLIGYDKNSGQAKVLSGEGQFANPLDQAQIDKIYHDIANGGADELLSVEEANKLGVPFGTSKGAAVGIVPGAAEKVQAAENSVGQIDQVLRLVNELQTHKGLDGATGTNRLLTAFPGSNARDFVAKFDQLKALLSLDNIKYLKGTGAISDAEQQLLANAASSLRRDTGQDAVVAELQRLGQVAQQTREKLQNVINAGSQSSMQEFESQYGGSEGTNPKVKASRQMIKPLPYLNSDGSSQGITTAVAKKYPEGSVGPGKGAYQGQCAVFVEQLVNLGTPSNRMGDSLSEKKQHIDNYGIPASKWRSQAKVGDVVVTSENATYGHTYIITKLLPNGKAQVSESNFKSSKRVSHDRIVSLNDPKIYGAFRGTLKV
jgi:hypothetical protein